MNRRMALIFSLFTLTGCMTSQLRVQHAQREQSVAKRPTAKFGELVSKPGETVLKHPPPETEPASLFPVKRDEVVPQAIHTLMTPTPVADPPLVAALREYLAGRTELAVDKIKGLDLANQEQILRLLPALAHASRADLSLPSDAAVLSSQVESAAEAAAKLCPLKIRKACFAWRVSQFGVYDPVPPKHTFLPGGCGMLYLELQNAPSLPADLPAGGRGYVTRLSGNISWLDAEGRAVGVAKPLEQTEFARSPVRDYFLKIEFDVPQQPGTYSLVVNLLDPTSKRRVKQSVELKVGS